MLLKAYLLIRNYQINLYKYILRTLKTNTLIFRTYYK